MPEPDTKPKPELYTRYPTKNIVIYNGTTILHYLFGSFGLMLGYNFLWDGLGGFLFSFIYLIFAFMQMYIIMPLTVCPNCVYYRLKDGLCTSGLNRFSRKIAKEGNLKDFAKRAGSPFCHNKLYMASLFIPILAIIPTLIINFSVILLIVFLTVLGLLLFRFFVVFQKTACVHCRAKNMCPNAKAMGLVDK
ncbi:MAG: hypothetical protein JSV49_10220 [Thermoplasmata archaeon]|nr:MAG: hypothetical protein JSV49_10220 [Thermoplasmata archaeon]